MTQKGEAARTCKNCGTVSEGRFCPACGQRLSVHKVTFGETFNDLAAAMFSVDAPLIITARDLFVRPGELLRNYLEGRRKSYYRPVSFFILATVLYIVIRTLIGFDPFRNSMIVVQEGNLDSTLLTEARNYMLKNINNFLFVFVFTLAVFMKLFFFKRYSLAEFLAISFYLLGIYTLLVTCNMFVVQNFGDELQPLGILAMCVYFLYVMCGLIRKNYILTVVKSLLLFLLAFMSYAITSYALSYLIVSLKQG